MHERIVGLYEENAAAWDEIRGRILHPNECEPIDRFLAAVTPGGKILDLGCGHGAPVGALMLERGFRVTGMDTSPSLIDLARDRLPRGEWLVGDMRQLALGQRFDGIIAWYSFFHLNFDDQRAMFARFRDHAEPGAPLCFPAGPAHGETIGEWQDEPLYHASLSQAEYRLLLETHGFDFLDFRNGNCAGDGPYVWLARRNG